LVGPLAQAVLARSLHLSTLESSSPSEQVSDIMIAVFGDFPQFSANNLRFFIKNVFLAILHNFRPKIWFFTR
jgi:hypothetical protein